MRSNFSVLYYFVCALLFCSDRRFVIECIVNRSNSKNVTVISENHIYKPPLDPSPHGGRYEVSDELSFASKPNTSEGRPKIPNAPRPQIFCGQLPHVENAISSMDSVKERRIPVNTVATYICVNGYKKVSGSEKIRCIMSARKVAEWETPTLKCQIVDCGDPGFVPNSERHAFKFTFNETVFYQCNPGYQPNGLPSIICSANERWNRPKPECKLIQCPKIEPKDDNLIIDYSNHSLVIGTFPIFRCKRGYRLNEEPPLNSPIICQWSGSWSYLEKVPHCVQAFCSRPQKPHKGLVIIPSKDNYRIGESILMSCQSTRNGEKFSAFCTENATWSRSLPYCPAPKHPVYCPTIKEFANGVHNGSKGNQTVGTKIVFRCNSHYLLHGVPWIICSPNGQWTSSVPFCISNDELSKTERTSSKLTFLLTSIIVTIVLIFLILIILFFRWRQRQQQRRHWRRYFGNYTYRQSKTNIYHNNQEMKLFKQTKSQTVPVTDL